MLFSTVFISVISLISVVFYFSRNIKILMIAFFLFCISILRSFYFTTDAFYYVEKYELLQYRNINNVWLEVISNNGKDPFFYFFSKFLSEVGFSSRLWLAMISLIFLVSISYLIYKYSNQVFLSFYSLVTLGYFYFSLTGLRQTLAISLFIIAIIKILEHKNLKAIFFIFLASMFHSSALITLLIFIVKKLKSKIIISVSLIICFSISFFYGETIKNILQSVINNISVQDSIERSTTLSYTGFFIQLSIYIFCYIHLQKSLQSDEKIKILLNLSFLGVIFNLFSPVVAEFFRVGLYFSIVNIILIPMALNKVTNQQLKYFYFLAIVILLFIHFINSAEFFEYHFYWEVGK